MISEDSLIGWLCFIDYQLERDHVINVPDQVRVELLARGWLRIGTDPDWDGHHECGITASGKAKSDINSPDWGIRSLPVEST